MTKTVRSLSSRYFRLLYGFISLLLISPLLSQTLPDTLSPAAEVSLITVYPGNELYSTFGHSAIRIQDYPQRLDRIYNYGTFDFDEPGFYIKFCRGKLDYKLAAYSYRFAQMIYEDERRPIISQTLDLSAAMKQNIYQFLEWNYLPENRGYRYDFFFDNCATRIRDVFENTLKDSLQLFYNDTRQLTFRNYIDIYLVNQPFSDYGIDLALGAKTDRIADPKEVLFLPDYLFESFAGARISHSGSERPLVSSTDTLFWIDGAQNPPLPAAFPWVHLITWSLFLIVLAKTIVDWRANKTASAFRRAIDYPLFGLAGLVGLLIVFLWFFTDHQTTPNNWNIAWAWPMHLLVFLPGLFKSPPKWTQVYLTLAAGVVLVLVIAWLWIPQKLHSATLPLALALMIRSFAIGRNKA